MLRFVHRSAIDDGGFMNQSYLDRITNAGYKIVKQYGNTLNSYCIFSDTAGYLYYLKINILLNTVRRGMHPYRFLGRNIFTPLNVALYLKTNNIKFTPVSALKDGARTNIVWNCEKHGDFYSSWNCIKSGQGCPKCGTELVSIKKRQDISVVKNKFRERGFILLSQNYINNETKMAYVCLKHPEAGVQYASYSYIQDKKSNVCRECINERRELYLSGGIPHLKTSKIRKTQKKFLKEVKDIFGDKYIINGTYKNSNTKISITCTNCDFVWDAYPRHLIQGHGCPNCNKSRGELYIYNWLKNNDIQFEDQYTFDNCVGIKRKLLFDFVIKNNGEIIACIEYQGKQHYEPIEFFGGITTYKAQIINDGIKRKYCSQNNIPLYEIPYWEYKKLSNVLINILEEINNEARTYL